jgi:hypothetical protein
VLGIPFNVYSGTNYEDGGVDILAADFFASLMVGDQIEIEDKVVADGFAENVELD